LRLAPRLALTFGLLAAVSTVGVGIAVRYRLADKETRRFQREVEDVCSRVVGEVTRQGDADHALVSGTCQEGQLAERVGIALDAHELDQRRTGLSQLVPRQREAFGLDELVLATEGGEFVAAAPPSLLATPSRELASWHHGPAEGFELRAGATPALVSRCTRRSERGALVGVVGARHLDPLLERLGRTLGVEVVPTWRAAAASATPEEDRARATCTLGRESGRAVAFDVLKSTRELEENLGDVNRAVAISAAIAVLAAFVAASVLARGLSRPLSVLAAEAGKVAAGEARPLDVKGEGEVRDLALAFERMLQDLSVTRQRLAAASRVAAWREVARRVAHEVKNPLAPIRAAVETLRRLRARDDPAFDGYFDEATRTVLDEVHRISNIVTEFTRFARLPPPRPQEVDPEELARHVVQIHKPAAKDVVLSHARARQATRLRADRDQVIQVLTNLVQNALDAMKDSPRGAVTLTTDTDDRYVSFSVSDDGPGIAPEIAARLFEPYATTKESGTGLGLAIAQRIAIEHNGELSYVGPGRSGKGAVFRLLLPVEGPPPMSEAV
jgi:two-component system, NtrC family, nitrogen regulation sensor histidine kinase NtrY